MVRLLKGVKYIIQVMTRLPSCCLLTSTLTLLFVTLVITDFVFVDGQTTAKTTTTTTKEPFLQSTMFVGLAAGIGGFIAFAILCCILWKCCCGSKD